MNNINQEKAIKAELNKNILVSAAAGSGKTRVLVERILYLLENNDDISLSNIVVMTFTKKATAEMKKRIKELLDKKLLENKNNTKLIKENALIASANIYTIDSFCKRILEEYYNYLSDKNSLYGTFDPSYRIADEKELSILYSDVLDELLEREYANIKYQPLFNVYIEKCSEKHIKAILIKGIHFLSSIPWAYEYLNNRIKNFEKEIIKYREIYIDKKISEINKLYDDNKKLLDNVYEILSESEENLKELKKEKSATYIKVCELKNQHIKEIENILICLKNIKNDVNVINDAYIKISNFTKPSFPKKNFVGVNDADYYRSLVDDMKELYEKIMSLKDIYEVMNLESVILCNNNEKLLMELLLEFYTLIIAEKKRKNIYAIGDYANLVLDILYDKYIEENGDMKRKLSDISKQISQKYKAVFIDEYQDTNYIQENILSAITCGFENKNAFMVGDIKQSIYGFRNAEPQIFANKYENYSIGNIDNELITLDQNYRSSKEIISYVNSLFSKIMIKDYGKIDYEKEGKLIAVNEKDIVDSNEVEIDLLTNDEASISYEANFVANKIYKLVKEEKCNYRDIVVLLRSTKDKAECFLDAFAKLGIPAYSDLNKGFYNRFEIKLMICVLRVIDNPLQNIPLASVITSDIFNVENKEIALIKVIYQESINFGKNDKFMLYDAIKYYIENFDEIVNRYKNLDVDMNILKEKLARFEEFLSEMIFRARFLSISELINLIYEKTCIRDIVLSMPDGRMRKANLEIFYENARDYENSSYVGLFNFLRYIERILLEEDDQGQAKIFDENDNVVRVMTIHSSKGLEFPVVFLSNVDKNYNFMDTRSNCLYNKEYGVALSYVDDVERYSYDTPKIKLVKELEVDKIKQEEMRMLYVALTRAEKKLYITGIANIDKVNFDGEEIKLNDIKKANSYLDLILKAYDGDSDFCKMNVISDIIEIDKIDKKIEKEEKKKEDNYVYKYEYLKNINPKYSVTSLKESNKIYNEISNQYYEDDNIKNDIEENQIRIDGTAIGNAYHKFMQFYDYSDNVNLCYNGLIDKNKIDKYICSNLGRRMAKASREKALYREHKFMKLFSKNELNEYTNEKDVLCDEKNIVIQGIIDAFMIEKDENGEEYIVLIDYKTDKINANYKMDIDKMKKYLINNYKVQLDIYAKVLNELTGLPVKEKYIYSFALDESIKMEN